jgi:hypothetical protein
MAGGKLAMLAIPLRIMVRLQLDTRRLAVLLGDERGAGIIARWKPGRPASPRTYLDARIDARHERRHLASEVIECLFYAFERPNGGR